MDEEKHLELIADRIKQLGGVPNLDPNGITKRAFSTFESVTRSPTCCARICSPNAS